jgi:hypothetical protein
MGDRSTTSILSLLLRYFAGKSSNTNTKKKKIVGPSGPVVRRRAHPVRRRAHAVAARRQPRIVRATGGVFVVGCCAGNA